MRNLSIAVASILLAYSSSLAIAQQNPIGGLVGGLINAAKQGAAKEEWEKVPPIKQTCFNATLRSNNLSVQSLIQNGIGPSDPRLNQANAACDEMINRKFRTDYECTFNINNRSIITWCDEAYAVPNGNGGARRLTVEEAINASASGQQLSMGQFEKPDAERRRLQMIQNNPSATNVPKPTWSCEKAKKPHEVTICNSYELTTIDNQYAQYWAMIKPIDKKRDFQKKADGFYKATLACNSNEVCIKQSLIVAIDNAADFLKANGTQVSTYTEQQAAKQKADEERQRIQAEQQRRIAEQQERDRQRQREDEERRLAFAKAEAEKAKAEAAIKLAELEKNKPVMNSPDMNNRPSPPTSSGNSEMANAGLLGGPLHEKVKFMFQKQPKLYNASQFFGGELYGQCMTTFLNIAASDINKRGQLISDNDKLMWLVTYEQLEHYRKTEISKGYPSNVFTQNVEIYSNAIKTDPSNFKIISAECQRKLEAALNECGALCRF